MIVLHMGGIPELAMFLGPLLLIAAFVRIARRNEAATTDEDDDWDAELGDLPTVSAQDHLPDQEQPGINAGPAPVRAGRRRG
ncbi:hypothetical protein FB561_3451 [Kribbella amoyensis]|uniref:Uncharacterized protein n=1 Tax=Kribbella amoyensis TaxID=996641 RepID=A0A561BU52_9ACTN|nr:hypothetical protein [Kribbella amoyensis]TWD82321.1 hypothetical protein FB561_3451 [Kribbella amoyensis]